MFASTVKPDTVRAPLSVLTEARNSLRNATAPARRGRHRRHHARQRAPGGPGAPTRSPSSPHCSPRPACAAAAAACAAPYSINPQSKSLTAMSSNAQLFERACRSIPGGVNSPVRAFRSVGGTPRFIKRAQGPVWDAEDKQYIDYVGSWARPSWAIRIPRSCARAGRRRPRPVVRRPTEAEIELAETLIARLPSLEQVRLVSSGTEATMTAIRRRAAPPDAPRSSSSKAATTAIPTACWSRPARASDLRQSQLGRRAANSSHTR